MNTTGNLSSYDKRKKNSVSKHRGGKSLIFVVFYFNYSYSAHGDSRRRNLRLGAGRGCTYDRKVVVE